MEESTKIGKYIYLEFFYPIKDYFSTIDLKEGIFDWGIPAGTAITFHHTIIRYLDFAKLNEFSFSLLVY